MKKQLPHYTKIDKVVGGTFYLPLPIEETLKKICPVADALMKDQDMYIYKNKVIWEDCVDIRKIWKALHWLKSNNPLYESIIIPTSPIKLSDDLQDCKIKDDNVNENISDDCMVHDVKQGMNDDCEINAQ